jgi:hypothetical protein
MWKQNAPSSSWVSVTTPSTSDVPLRTTTAFLVASATTSALAAAARPEPATRRSEWKGQAGEDGVAKMDEGGAAAARRKVCAGMAAVTNGGGGVVGVGCGVGAAADKVGSARAHHRIQRPRQAARCAACGCPC